MQIDHPFDPLLVRTSARARRIRTRDLHAATAKTPRSSTRGRASVHVRRTDVPPTLSRSAIVRGDRAPSRRRGRRGSAAHRRRHMRAPSAQRRSTRSRHVAAGTRSSARSRARATRCACSALAPRPALAPRAARLPARPLERATSTGGSTTCTSDPVGDGPSSSARYVRNPSVVQAHLRVPSPIHPHVHGLSRRPVAASRGTWPCVGAGNRDETRPPAVGAAPRRRAAESRARRKRTPWCAQADSPGRGPSHLPQATSLTVWCGARNGRSRDRRVTTGARRRCGSPSPPALLPVDSGGSRPGNRRASIVLPAPRGPS